MTAIAWAMMFLAICISDAAYTIKFGASYAGANVAAFLAGAFLIGCIACTAFEMGRSRRVGQTGSRS